MSRLMDSSDMDVPSNEQALLGVQPDDESRSESTTKKIKMNAIPILPIGVATLRFAVILLISWIIFYVAMSTSAQWTVDIYVPWSFWLLHYILIFGIIGGGWPFVAPFGLSMFKPYWSGHGRLVLGLGMTVLTVGMGLALSAFFVNVWPKYPLSPGGAWFGIGLVVVTLWWVLCIQISDKPLVPMTKIPLFNIAVNSLICILLAAGVFQLVDYDAPFTEDPSNPKGPFPAAWLFGCLVSIVVWVSNFSNITVFQRWPFSPSSAILPNHYVQHIALTATVIFLGWFMYKIIIASGVDVAWYTYNVMASQVSWALYHSVAFDFWPFHNKVAQPKRGLYSFALTQVVIPFFWIFFCRITLLPIFDIMVAAHPPYEQIFPFGTMIPIFGLHFLAPLLLVHHLFFMRWPLRPPGPPLFAANVGVVQELEGDDILVVEGAKEEDEKETLVENMDLM